MRNKILSLIRSKIPEGMILPWWALTVRAILYPLDFFYWRMSKTRGYQIENDTWIIEGMVYSAELFRVFHLADGEIYRIRSNGSTVTLERLRELE